MLDIIIVNWNSGTQLHACITSINAHSGGVVGKIIVVDNGSVDGSEASADGLPNVSLIRSGSNLGFGKACNVGAKDASSNFLLFLNPDAAIYKNTLTDCLRYMQDPSNSSVGICGVQLLDETGQISRSCSRFPSPSGFFAHSLGLDRFIPRLGHAMVEWDHGVTRDVNQVIGAFFLVRQELFKSLNGFDERFFVYFEEVDFSYRAFKARWRTVYLADVQSFHAGGGTSRQIKARRLFYSLRSRLLYAFKHFSFVEALAVFVATSVLEPVTRLIYAALRGSWPALKETSGAFAMLWRWLPVWLVKGTPR